MDHQKYSKAALALTCLVLVSACNKNQGNSEEAKPGTPSAAVNPQVAFEDFESSTRQDGKGCQLDLATIYNGESFNEYECKLVCDPTDSNETLQARIDVLKLISEKSKVALSVEQPRTRKNMAETVAACVAPQLEAHVKNLAARNEKFAAFQAVEPIVKERCTLSETKAECVRPATLQELSTQVPAYKKYIDSSDNSARNAQLSKSIQAIYKELYDASVAQQAQLNAKIRMQCGFSENQVSVFVVRPQLQSSSLYSGNMSWMDAEKTAGLQTTLEGLTQALGETVSPEMCDRLVNFSIKIQSEETYDLNPGFYSYTDNLALKSGLNSTSILTRLNSLASSESFEKAKAFFSSDIGRGVSCRSTVPNADCAAAIDRISAAIQTTGKMVDKEYLFFDVRPEANCMTWADRKATTMSIDATAEQITAQIQKCRSGQ